MIKELKKLQSVRNFLTSFFRKCCFFFIVFILFSPFVMSSLKTQESLEGYKTKGMERRRKERKGKERINVMKDEIQPNTQEKYP